MSIQKKLFADVHHIIQNLLHGHFALSTNETFLRSQKNIQTSGGINNGKSFL